MVAPERRMTRGGLLKASMGEECLPGEKGKKGS
jgi:hypothetical protein